MSISSTEMGSVEVPSPVRLAVIGAGFIGKKHLSVIQAEPAAELVGIVDPAPMAAEVAKAYGTRLYPSIDALMNEAAPDGAVVATPTEWHLQPTLDLLRAGVDVLVEKPIAATNEEARLIADEAERTGRKLLVGHHRRYYPVIERAREIIDGGAIGRLVTVHGQWTLKKAETYFEADWRQRRPAGPILTNLIHDFDTLRFICGEFSSISADITSAVHGFEKEDAAALTMSFVSGAIGTFLISDSSPSPWAWELATGENPVFPPAWQNTHRFTGSEGALEFPDLALWRYSAGEDGWHYPISREACAFAEADAFALQSAHFCAVIRGEEEPRITAEDGARTLRATLAVFDAAETGRRLKL